MRSTEIWPLLVGTTSLTRSPSFCHVILPLMVSKFMPRLLRKPMGNKSGNSDSTTCMVTTPDTPRIPKGISALWRNLVHPPTPIALAAKVGSVLGCSPRSAKHSHSALYSWYPMTPCCAPVSTRPEPGVTIMPMYVSMVGKSKDTRNAGGSSSYSSSVRKHCTVKEQPPLDSGRSLTGRTYCLRQLCMISE